MARKTKVNFDSVAISKAGRLRMVNESIKALEKEQKSLKGFFVEAVGGGGTVVLGDNVIEIQERTRSGFDSKTFIADQGEEIAKPYMYETDYLAVKISKVK